MKLGINVIRWRFTFYRIMRLTNQLDTARRVANASVGMN